MITAGDITGKLAEMGVATHDALFVHAGMQSALRVAGDRPVDKLDTVLAGLLGAVPDGLLVMPTFTYSATENDVFDPATTPSTVGALTEQMRAHPRARRTLEPNFSCVLIGATSPDWEQRLFAPGDTDAFGDEGIFGLLRGRDAKLLFLGVSFRFCTYVHHVEQRLGVPYRYIKEFPAVVRVEGADHRVTARYFVRRLDEVAPYFDSLADALAESGRSTTASLAGGPRLLLTDAAAVLETAKEGLASDPDFLVRR